MLKAPFERLLFACVLLTLLTGCAAVTDAVVGERSGEWHDTKELSLIYYDESRGASISTQWEIDDLLAEGKPDDGKEAEATQPFKEVDFKLKIIDVTREKITLTVKLEDQPEQKMEMHLGERREFRPKNPDRRVGLSFVKSSYYY